MMMGGSRNRPSIGEIIGLVVNNSTNEYDDRVLLRVVETLGPNPDCTSSIIIDEEITNHLSFNDLRPFRYYHPMALYSTEADGHRMSALYLHSDSMWVYTTKEESWKI